jgi:hypothetical protein
MPHWYVLILILKHLAIQSDTIYMYVYIYGIRDLSSNILNLVVRFGTSEEVSCARAVYNVHVADTCFGRKLTKPCCSFPAEYPWWYGQWPDKLHVTGVQAKSAAAAVQQVLRPICDELGRGYIEATPDVAGANGAFTVYLHAYGVRNAIEVIRLLRDKSFVAYGNHQALRWCTYCETIGHSVSECRLPVIMIRSKDRLNSSVLRMLSDATGAKDAFMGARNTANVHNKKFAFFVYGDDSSHLRAAKFFAAMDLMGAFQARPRAFAGIPKMCHACGLLQDETDTAEVAWHQAGDGKCRKHEYNPSGPRARRTLLAPGNDTPARPAVSAGADDNDASSQPSSIKCLPLA